MNHQLPHMPLSRHHDPQGGFRNPWPLSQPHGVGGLVKWMVTRRRRPDAADIAESIAPAVAPCQSGVAGLTVTWIGHSTFLIQSSGTSVLTDPIWSNRASPFQLVGPRRHTPPGLSFDKLPHIDAVFISHDHYDHLDDATVRRLIDRFPVTKWIVPLRVGEFLVKRGASDVTEMDWWEERTGETVSASCTPAAHFSGRHPWDRNATLWSGWVIGLENHRVFFAGDTGFHPEFAAITTHFGPLDAAILPIGAYDPRWFMQPVHMNPEDAVAAYSRIVSANGSRDCIFIPSHWGTFRLTDEPLAEPPRRLLKAWADAALPDTALWLLRTGETRGLDQQSVAASSG